MSGYILCQTKKADKPFFVESINTNIYSLEELCYFLYHNLYLVDSSVINENLCIWISEELDLPRLAAKLRPHLGKFASAEDVLYPVFKEINYLTYDELKALNVKLAKLDQEAPLLRKKRKGDALVANKMYVSAIKVYQQLLKKEGLEQIRPGLTMSVWHNLGCAYSYLFQMEKAQECFLEAYREAHSKDALKAYIIAYSSVHDKTDYDKVMEELEVDEELKKDIKEEIRQSLKAFESVPEEKTDEKNLDALLERLMKDYHRSTGS